MNVGIQLYIEPVTSKISKFYVVETSVLICTLSLVLSILHPKSVVKSVYIYYTQRGVIFKHRTYDGVISDIHMRDLKSWPGVI